MNSEIESDDNFEKIDILKEMVVNYWKACFYWHGIVQVRMWGVTIAVMNVILGVYGEKFKIQDAGLILQYFKDTMQSKQAIHGHVSILSEIFYSNKYNYFIIAVCTNYMVTTLHAL